VGDEEQQPSWPLKIMLANHVTTGEEHCEELVDELRVEHAVEFFLGLNDVISAAM